ncbi:nuclear export mediator factor NEMF homolog isoform X3 [Nilaparvata lugens]|uniref:nuclear export mediator factor NEMF homolog isoform X3 n=1 Tax=Nilaparvata lugens TaxID=108931 RepID=UPI00193DFF94|nr:nuclear export mediator factor NEMF homolog isoform X3 [Nilaparvata lugens]
MAGQWLAHTRLVGMRVNQVYDIDHKTYLIKLQRSEEKCILLLESGHRFHTTAYEWPKNMAPSGFSMKMRKHLKNKRLEVFRQLGVDRIIDLQFGSGEAAYHVILELYDRGNIILTDHELTILNVLRPHTEGDRIRFAVREKYPTDRAKQQSDPPTLEQLTEILQKASKGQPLKKILNPHLAYGAALIDHVLLKSGFPSGCAVGKGFEMEDIPKLMKALTLAEEIITEATKAPSKGYIVQKAEVRPKPDGSKEEFMTNVEFHPNIFEQFKNSPIREFDSFNMSVDEFFSTMESQKIDLKAIQQEKDAMKKLENVKKDHSSRLEALEKTQEVDKQRAELITRNQALVDEAVLVIRSALANQVSWPDIQDLVKEATARGDPVASAIKKLKLDINHITLLLSDPYVGNTSDDDEDSDDDSKLKPMMIDIDLDLGAFANAKRFYDQKKMAAKKQQKTIESQGKALKSAEKKTKQTLKEVQAITNINKARKVFWFEKFLWFVSSENYLVIGGRDQQQNELIVKRYLNTHDIYVHADITGASSIVIINPSGQPVPPKTLNEAGAMAVCYSAAWEAKVVTNAWWVYAHQVSKTAPTGEYLTTGSFMIRGKKNFLPPCHLIMGFSFLFKLEEGSIPRHKDERRIRGIEDDIATAENAEDNSRDGNDEEIELSDDEGKDKTSLEPVKEVDEVNEADKKESDVNAEENDEDKDDGTPSFPDTEIVVKHTSDKTYVSSTNSGLELRSSFSTSESNTDLNILNKESDGTIHIRPSAQKRNQKNQRRESETDNNEQMTKNEQKNQQQLKRGQRAKMKKIKEKYKDQDEEERKLIMDILQSAGTGKESKKNKKGSGNKNTANMNKPKVTPKAQPKPVAVSADAAAEVDDPEPSVQTNVDMLDSLTGCPLPEDELLFAVPVIAPYNTIQNYKYKIKMMPGTSKRGKAARAAVSVFLRDKAATNHEKDLLKSVKEQELFLNLPGKVKLLAPQLQKHKK